MLAGAVLAGAGRAGPPGPPAAKGLGDYLPPSVGWVGRLEFVEMLSAILKGDPPDADFGWFHPSQSRHDWKWLAERLDVDRNGAITRAEFKGPAEFFERLDRDHDGRLTPADFDWSEDSPLTKQARLAVRLARSADANTDGRITAEEWQALFKQAAKGKDSLTAEDVQRLLFPPPPPRPAGPPPDMPSRGLLLHGLLTGEIGSPCEGPSLGKPAPNFSLPTHDGTQRISLSDFRGKKPVVLVFGSFT
jgi:hypothetical protein